MAADLRRSIKIQLKVSACKLCNCNPSLPPSWTHNNSLTLYPCSTKTREVLGNPSPTPERFPETRGKSQGSREIWRAEGMDFPIPPEFWWSTDNLSASIFLQGVDQKILPCGQGRIDSVKINPSLLMMTDCDIRTVTNRIEDASSF